MEPKQLAGVAERKLRHAVVPRLPQDFDNRYEQTVPADPTASPQPIRANNARLRNVFAETTQDDQRRLAANAADGDITFVNATRNVTDQDGVGWTTETVLAPPDLWAEKFYGFEFLRWPVFGHATPSGHAPVRETFDRWLLDWTSAESTRIGRERYLRRVWTPYSVSLRVLNWCRYYGWAKEGMSAAAERTLRREIFKNARFLRNHLEYDVGGNHLVENGTALVAAGLLFQRENQTWTDTGIDVLTTASEQFLNDGGHFERSPMYHVLVLTRYLTVIDLLSHAGWTCPDRVVSVAQAAVGFLRSLRPPDHQIPLLNDAVLGEGLTVDECLSYAKAIDAPIDISQGGRSNVLSSSGYYWLGDGADRMLVDGGDGGPPHLPGHTHNDPFSILLWVNGNRLVTDTGVFDYTPGERRRHARSVRAHNTVQVGDSEPVDIGGRYLAGQRLSPTVRYGVMDEVTVFEGRYEKSRSRSSGYEHCRRVCAADDWWLVDDLVKSSPDESLLSRFHCHPNVRVDISKGSGTDTIRLHSQSGTVSAYLYPLAGTVDTQGGRYFPKFGTEQDRTVVRLGRDGGGRLSVLLTTEPHESVRVKRGDWRPRVITLDGERRELPTGIRT